MNRRLFFKSFAVGLFSLPFMGKVLAKGCGAVKDGFKYGYVQDATKATDKKYAKHVAKHKAANAICAKCKWYKPKDKKATKTTAPCTMLGKKLVCDKGWCNKYKFDKKKA